MSNRRPPNRGTKVNLGKNAPVTQEGVGVVAAGSLADESNRRGGAFSTNRQHETVPAGEIGQTKALGDKATGGRTQQHTPSKGQGGPAPTYVNSQYYRDPKGPHGKNLKEGFEDDDKYEDGVAKAFAADIGSEDDPSRAAEKTFLSKPPAEAQRASISGQEGYNVLEADKTL